MDASYNFTMNISSDNGSLSIPSWSFSYSSKITIMVVFSAILAVGIIGNVIVLLLVILVKSMQTTVNLCLAVMAMADLGVLCLLPILAVIFLFDIDAGFIGENFCKFLLFYDRGAMVCSIFIFLFISVERYLALCHPFRTLHHWTGWRMIIVLTSIWVLAALLAAPYVIGSRFEQTWISPNKTVTQCYLEFDKNWTRIYETVLIVVVFLLPVPVLCYLYGRMVHSMHSIPLSETYATRSVSVRKSRCQVIKMLISVVVMFIISNIPFRIYILLYFYANDFLSELTAEGNMATNWTARLLTFTNNAANPIIYFSVSSNFREAFRSLFCRQPKPASDKSHGHSRHTDTSYM